MILIRKILEIDELKHNAKAFEYNLLKPIPVAMKSFDEQLKVKVIELEQENENVKKSLKEVKDKYESLRDIDSTIKEVSQMKKLLKINDSNFEMMKNEKEELLKKIEILEVNQKSNKRSLIENKLESEQKGNKWIEELKGKVIMLENENNQLKKLSIEYKEKYDGLREVDSHVTEVSNIKKILKENDKKLEIIQKGNLELNNKIRPIENKVKEYDEEIGRLNERLHSSYQQIEGFKEIEHRIKKLIK